MPLFSTASPLPSKVRAALLAPALVASALHCAPGTSGLCAPAGCSEDAGHFDADDATAPSNVAAVIARVHVGATALPIGPKREVSWRPLPAFVRAASPLAVGVDAAGEPAALAFVVGDEVARLDADSTARALVAVAAGALYVSPAERAATWESAGRLDLRELRARLEGRPTHATLRAATTNDPGVRLLVASAVAALRGQGATRAIGVTLDGDGDGLTLGDPRLSGDRRTVFVDAALRADRHELKALSVDGVITYLRPAGFPDPLAGLWGGAAREGFAIPFAPRAPTEASVRVLAPSTLNLVGALAGGVPAEERRAQGHATMRTILGQSINIVAALLPDLLGVDACAAAIVENLSGNVARLAEGPRATSDLRGSLWDLVVRVRENLGTFAACQSVVERSLWDRLWGLFERIGDVWDATVNAVEQVLALTELATGPMLSVHRVELCAACPGATASRIPACAPYRGELACGEAAACAPTAERCAGGSDEDCDGRVDCDDPSCAADPSCARCPSSPCAGRSSGATVCDGAARVLCAASGPCVVEGSRVDCAAAVPGAVGACAAGACVVGSCLRGRGDCDGVAGNGCEQDTLDSPLHCGGCGRRCASGETCVAGSCRPPGACSGYLRIASPTAGDVRSGARVRYEFTAPGCPTSQQYTVAFRQCCSNALDCARGYGPGVDPDRGCPGSSTGPLTGTSVNVTLPSVSGRWRTSVYPVGQTQWAAPFVVLNLVP